MVKTLELHQGLPDLPSGEAVSWYHGALGEMVVGGHLAQLPQTWTVLHSVPVGETNSDIDHVVIGPPGVFTINTKAHVGRAIWAGGTGSSVDGFQNGYVHAALHEAEDAARRLSEATALAVPVTPVLVFVAPGELTITASLAGSLRVISDEHLVDDLLGSEPRLSDEEVRRITTVAALSRTWSSRPFSREAGYESAVRFLALTARHLQVSISEGRVPVDPTEVRGPSPKGAVEKRRRRVDTRGLHAPRSLRSRNRRAESGRRQVRRRKTRLAEAILRIALSLGLFWFLFAVAIPGYLQWMLP